MKFTTLIPTTRNDGTPFEEEFLRRVIDQLWTPFEAMSEEHEIHGQWTDDDGTGFL